MAAKMEAEAEARKEVEGAKVAAEAEAVAQKAAEAEAEVEAAKVAAEVAAAKEKVRPHRTLARACARVWAAGCVTLLSPLQVVAHYLFITPAGGGARPAGRRTLAHLPLVLCGAHGAPNPDPNPNLCAVRTDPSPSPSPSP